MTLFRGADAEALALGGGAADDLHVLAGDAVMAGEEVAEFFVRLAVFGDRFDAHLQSAVGHLTGHFGFGRAGDDLDV